MRTIKVAEATGEHALAAFGLRIVLLLLLLLVLVRGLGMPCVGSRALTGPSPPLRTHQESTQYSSWLTFCAAAAGIQRSWKRGPHESDTAISLVVRL